MKQIFIESLKKELLKSLPGFVAQSRMIPAASAIERMHIPDTAKDSAVLCLLIYEAEVWKVLLIRRTTDGSRHSGQIALPGGKFEVEDIDLQETALRETFEEIGLLKDDVEIIGALTPLYVPISNYKIQPFVGIINTTPNWILSQQEVDEIIIMPLRNLLENKEITELIANGIGSQKWVGPAYRVDDKTIVWGATAMILSELEALLVKNKF